MWGQCQSWHSCNKSVLPYGFRGWWALHWQLSLSTGRGKITINQAWLEKSAQEVWMESIGGFHSLEFTWALFSADGNSDFWSGATYALSVCGMGISAKSQCFWWVFPCFQPSAKSDRGAWITSSLRDVLEHIWHSELALKGSRSAGAMLLVFLGSVKEDYTALVSLDPTCAKYFAVRILRWASPSSTASKTLKKLSRYVSFSTAIL